MKHDDAYTEDGDTIAAEHVLLNRLHVIKTAFTNVYFTNTQHNILDSTNNLPVLQKLIDMQTIDTKAKINSVTLKAFLKFQSILKLTTNDYWKKDYHEFLKNITE